MNGYISELKLRLTGGVLDLDISDDALTGCVNSAFRQLQRYIDTTVIQTIPYSQAIDLSNCGVSSVVRVYRAQGYMDGNSPKGDSFSYDPMYLAAWQALGGMGGMSTSRLSSWVSDIGAFNTQMQIRNTLSTDLVFRFDKHTNLLYINCSMDMPSYITIEFIPRYNDVSQIVSDYWIDILLRLSLAICKQVIGRIRKKFGQSNALWNLDTDILAEGLEEEKELQELLRVSSQLTYPLD